MDFTIREISLVRPLIILKVILLNRRVFNKLE